MEKGNLIGILILSSNYIEYGGNYIIIPATMEIMEDKKESEKMKMKREKGILKAVSYCLLTKEKKKRKRKKGKEGGKRRRKEKKKRFIQ